MSLKFSTSGRPMIECINPECKRLHAIHRRGDYVQRTQVRVSCRSCGTKWQLNDEDKTKLQTHYQQRQKELNDKKLEKAQNNQEKMKQNPESKKIEKNEPPEKQTKQKRGWLDDLLS